MMKEIEDDTKKWKDIPYSWIRRISTIKVTILPKAINLQIQFNPYQITKDIFHITRTKYFKIYTETQKPFLNATENRN